MMGRPRLGLVAVVLLIAAVPSVGGAQSPPPSGPPSSGPTAPSSPVASAIPADCTSAAALLPRSVDDLSLDATTTSGVVAIDPDELLDPLLASLGRGRSDVCVVAFRYGESPDALAGQLLRIAGVEVPDLASRFTDALRERLVAYGVEASPETAEAVGRTIWTLDITADGARSQVVATQFDDVLLLTTGQPAMDRLLSLLTPPLVKASTPDP